MAANGDATCLVNSCVLTDSVVQRLDNGSPRHKGGPKRAPPPPPTKPTVNKSPLHTANRAHATAPSPNTQQKREVAVAQRDSGQDSDASHLQSTTAGTCPSHQSPHAQSTSSGQASLTSAEFPNEAVNSKINSAGTSKPSISMASKTSSSDSPAGIVHTTATELISPGGSSGGVEPNCLNGSECHKMVDGGTSGAEGGVRIEVSHEQNGHENGSDLGHRAAGHVRGASDTSSTSDVGSPDSEASQERASSSSSLSRDTSSLSQDNSFASRALLLEHLKSELYQQRTASDPTLLTSGHQAQTEQDNEEFVQQLLEHIVSLKMELASLQEENESLKQVRTSMDDELHTLTENLFEEAYKMVDNAKGGKVVAEKRLADAAGKIDAMETEMSALKNLLEAPPDKHSLNPHHHHKHRRPSVKKVIKKISRKAGIGRSSPSTKHHRHSVTLLEHRSETKGAMLVEGEPVQEDYDAFCRWIEELKVGGAQDHSYLWSVVATDVRPCLAFRNAELSEQVLHAVEQNHLLMESLPSTATEERVHVCAFSGSGNGQCTHRLQLGDQDQWHHISQQARNRIAAACDFYMYISHIKKGIIKLDASQLYWRVARLRALMSLARLNLSLPEDKPPQ